MILVTFKQHTTPVVYLLHFVLWDHARNGVNNAG